MMWVVFALLTGGAVFSVLWPLSRKPVLTDPRELDVAFYKAQTAEIERDAARGVIGAQDAEAARTEAGRRLVAAAHGRTGSPLSTTSSVWPARLAAIGTLVLVPAIALGLYHLVGAPGMRDEPLQARLDAPPNSLDMAAAIAKIEQHLAKDPNDGRGWAILAKVYMQLRRYSDAATAYTNLIRVLGPTEERYDALGEAQMFAAGGDTVSAEAKRSFAEAAKLDPKSPRANYYLGVAALQDGDKTKALEIWRKIISDSPPDARWLPVVRSRIAEASGEAPSAGPGPDRPNAAAVAAMPADQQQQMIHRMVDGLAARLKANGHDIEGWLRLVRAYRVLNDGDKAKVALTDARRTFAADPAATKRLDDLAHELGLES